MRRPNRTWWIGVAAAVAMLLVAAAAFARPGGGHSYSGPSSSSGGGGGGELIGLLIWLVFRHPAIGIPVVLVVIIVAIVRSRMNKPSDGWATVHTGGGASGWDAQPVQRPTVVSRTELDRLRRLDPEFSTVLFEDFAYLLYAELQRGRAGQLAPLAPYVHPAILQALHSDPNLADVRGIVIGAMRIVRFSDIGVPRIQVELEFEANLEEVFRQGGTQRFYVLDRMLLVRSREAKSRAFERARILDCPNCGAPLSAVRGTQCTYCKQEVGGGRFDWQVEGARTLSREQRGPLLTSNVDEAGTDLPTIKMPGVEARMRELQLRDPGFGWEVLQQRVAHIFGALQAGWSGRDASMIRPYISDNLFQSMVYWIDLYTRERCRNVNDQARILALELSNVLSDKHYDAITLRVFAEGLDYTISDDGRLLSGSKSRVRTYSEYWTLIRGAQKKGEPKGDANCPNCGAPLKIDQAGNCTYCRAKVTAGEFDWVLSRIEQDEAYSG